MKPETASEQFAIAQIAALVRLAPAEVAGFMFLSEFDRAAHDELDHSACTACQKKRIHGLENSKANGSGPASGCFEQHASFCPRHMRELKRSLPEQLQKTMEESGTELQRELQECLQRARQAVFSGGGVLVGAAGFFINQWGILD